VSCTICRCRCRRPVRKLLDTPSYYIRQENYVQHLNVKVEVFWAAMPCSVVAGNQRFRDPCCLTLPWRWRQHRNPKHWCPSNNTMRRHNPEDLDLNLHLRENFKSHLNVVTNDTFQAMAVPVYGRWTATRGSRELRYLYPYMCCLMQRYVLH
jgi:hypothetical protein